MALRFLPSLPPRQLVTILENGELDSLLDGPTRSRFSDVRAAAIEALVEMLAAPPVQQAVVAMPGGDVVMMWAVHNRTAVQCSIPLIFMYRRYKSYSLLRYTNKIFCCLHVMLHHDILSGMHL